MLDGFVFASPRRSYSTAKFRLNDLAVGPLVFDLRNSAFEEKPPGGSAPTRFVASMTVFPSQPLTASTASAMAAPGTATSTASASETSPPSLPIRVTSCPALSQRSPSPPPTLPLPTTAIFMTTPLVRFRKLFLHGRALRRGDDAGGPRRGEGGGGGRRVPDRRDRRARRRGDLARPLAAARAALATRTRRARGASARRRSTLGATRRRGPLHHRRAVPALSGRGGDGGRPAHRLRPPPPGGAGGADRRAQPLRRRAHRGLPRRRVAGRVAGIVRALRAAHARLARRSRRPASTPPGLSFPPMTREYPSVLELVGHTPIVRLDALGRGVKPKLIAKLEYLNPGGSVKDRIGLAMIERAEQEGKLQPGGTIVEPT